MSDDKKKDLMDQVELLALLEEDVEVWSDETVERSVTFLREQSEKYEKELEARAVKKQAKKDKAENPMSIQAILDDTL